MISETVYELPSGMYGLEIYSDNNSITLQIFGLFEEISYSKLALNNLKIIEFNIENIKTICKLWDIKQLEDDDNINYNDDIIILNCGGDIIIHHNNRGIFIENWKDLFKIVKCEMA